MEQSLKILLLEDNKTDAEMIERFLLKKKKSIEFKHVSNKQTFLQQLDQFQPDIILSDHTLPQFNSSQALIIARERFPDIPFIMITGTVSEEFAVEIIKSGADDYLLKDRINRLPLAIDSALEQRKIKKEKQEALNKLIQSEEKYRTIFLKSPLPKWVFDSETLRFVEVNEAAIRHYGYTQEEFLNMTIKDIRPAEDIGRLMDDIREIGKGRDTRKGYWRHLKKNGELIVVETTAHSIDYNNRKARMVVANDITEKIAAEEELRRSELRLNEAQTIAHISNWEIDLIRNVHTWSDELFRIYGLNKDVDLPSAELFLAYMHPEDADFAQRKMQQAFETFNNSSFNFRFIRKDGAARYGYTEWKFEFDTNQKPLRLFGILQDITERKEAEEELNKSNERFEMVVSATNDVIWDWNMESNEFWWNENYYSFFGYDKGTAPDIISWYEGFHPDDKERVLEGIHSSIKNKDAFWTDEYRFLKADGTIAFILDCGYIQYTRKGRPYRMVGAMLDITNRKKAEEELKKSFDEKQALAIRMSIILNTLPANIALLDAKGYIVDVNDAWQNFANGNDFIGSNYSIGDNYLGISETFFNDDKTDGRTMADGIKDVIDNKVKEFVFEYAFHSPGADKWFRMVATPLLGKEFAGAVVMHIDISEIRRLEQERLQSKEEEQKKITQAMLLGQEKERNAIGVELHDNVNQILVGTNLVLSMLTQDSARVAELIPSCIANIRNAINENRKIAHELVTPDLSNETLIEQLQRLCENMLATGGIQTDIHHEDFSEDWLTNDQKLAIYRVAQEQCTNIIKYARAKSVMLLLYNAGNTFTMRLIDDGIGMDENKAAKGIGLRNIASRIGILGGTVNIDTAPGKGFALEIEIPIS